MNESSPTKNPPNNQPNNSPNDQPNNQPKKPHHTEAIEIGSAGNGKIEVAPAVSDEVLIASMKNAAATQPNPSIADRIECRIAKVPVQVGDNASLPDPHTSNA